MLVLHVLFFIQDYDKHQMEKPGFNMRDEEPKSSSASNAVSRLEMQQRRNKFLIHACQCRDSSCSKQLCIKMKMLLRHARDCKMRTSGKCTACNFFIKLCATHSQECHENKCLVPLCANLKKKLRERRLREQARSQPINLVLMIRIVPPHLVPSGTLLFMHLSVLSGIHTRFFVGRGGGGGSTSIMMPSQMLLFIVKCICFSSNLSMKNKTVEL